MMKPLLLVCLACLSCEAARIEIECEGTHRSSTRYIQTVLVLNHIQGIPLGVDKTWIPALVKDTSYVIKSGTGVKGNYRAISFTNPGGAKVYTETIINGFDVLPTIGSPVTAEQGNMVGPTKDGVETRILLEQTTVLIAVIDFTALGNNGSSPIYGWTVFELEGFDGQDLVAKFVKTLTDDETTSLVLGPNAKQLYVTEIFK